MTRDEIEAEMTPAGGYTRATLQKWGVPWPPPPGWKKALIAGATSIAPKRDKQHHLERMFARQGGRCHICGEPAVLDYEGGKAGRPMSAVRFRLGSSYGKPGRVRPRAMAHRQCAQERAAQIEASQPIEEIRMRANAFPVMSYALPGTPD